MLLRLRVSLADRPGGLGQVAKVLGTLGADILQVTVLEREMGRAVDDFVVSWPGPAGADEVRERFSAVPGVRVEGVWPTREVPGSAPDYDLLMHVAAEPSRGLATLVDALPGLCGAEWSVAYAGGSVVHSSIAAPELVDLPEPPPRAATLDGEKVRLMLLPMTAYQLHLLVARADGPGFHRAELERAVRIVDVVSALAARV
ncbi:MULTISPECIES: amino acid-binding protein [Nonomuraea]|uniref:Amino acid-binding protein n=2 Tax=Nonomuraea TaxID=83681 RepID=A0ABW1BYG5_9ACTN|nr:MULTISPECIES: amino acid-binding protein [Nonomuraea]MDA0646455.1 amino acid-binding protein [Nonomuraea ferruginea]